MSKQVKGIVFGTINAVFWGALVGYFSLFFGLVVFVLFIGMGIKIAMTSNESWAKIDQDRVEKELIKKHKHQKELQEATKFFG